MTTGKTESEILTKDMSCECKCRFDQKNVIQINGGITINVYFSVKSEKDYIWNPVTCSYPATCSCQNGNI